MKTKQLPLLFLTSSFLTLAGQVNAQCTATITASDSCSPTTLHVKANFAIEKIVWKQGSSTLQTNVTTWAANATTVAAGNGYGTALNQLKNPGFVRVDTANNVYIADGANYRVVKWAPGATVGVAVAGGNGQGAALNQFGFPVGLFVDSAMNVTVSDITQMRLTKWAPGATAGVVVAGGNGAGSAANQFGFFGPGGITLKNNNWYIMDGDPNCRVQKWAVGATSATTVAGGNGFGMAANQLAQPGGCGGVCVDNAGNVYVSEYSANRISKWAPGAIAGVTVVGGNGSGSTANQLNRPNDIFLTGSGSFFIADASNHRVQKWEAGATSGTTVAGGNGAGSAANQLAATVSVAFDKNWNLYVTDNDNPRVQKFAVLFNDSFVVNKAGGYTAVITGFDGCSVTVNYEVGNSLESLIAPSSAQNICAGDTVNLYTTNANRTYSWLKNGTAVSGAIRDSLKVSESGSYAVIVSANGKSADTSSLVSVNVNVLPNPVITANGGTLSTGTYSTYQWYKNGVAITGATSASYTPTEDGSYAVSVTSAEGCEGLSAAVPFTAPTSVKDVTFENGLEVYPNPATNDVSIKMPSAPGKVTLKVFDIQGRIVLQKDMEWSKGKETQSLSIASLKQGLYFLNLAGEHIQIVHKLVKY